MTSVGQMSCEMQLPDRASGLPLAAWLPPRLGGRVGHLLVHRLSLAGVARARNNREIIRLKATLITLLALVGGLASSSAAVLSVAGNDTLVGNRAANLIVNGSFEADGGIAANGAYWATGTTLTPTMSLTGWTAAGQAAAMPIGAATALAASDQRAFPDGTNGLYFGGGIMASVIPFPTEARTASSLSLRRRQCAQANGRAGDIAANRFRPESCWDLLAGFLDQR